jgi:hypothetical protein
MSGKRTIWKYELDPREYGNDLVAEVEMPAGARVLRLAAQSDRPHIWAEVNPEAEQELRSFTIYPTGVEVRGEYVGTFTWGIVLGRGELVWHVYE